jgi:hypothetical protein
MFTLQAARSLPRRVHPALLAVLLVPVVVGGIATPSHAAAATTAVTKGGLSRLSAVLDLRTVPRTRGLNGMLSCTPGDYARATNRWTNAYGQTLAVGMYVGVNSSCQVRFREHLVGSGSNGCSFDSDNAAIWQSDVDPPYIGKDVAGNLGHNNFNAIPNDPDCDAWYSGLYHTVSLFWVMSSDGAFHVHFLSPDHQGTDHAGCSQARAPDLSSQPNDCFYY